jgi:O-antigen ligase
MASIASRRRVPLSWRFAEWRENVEISPRTRKIAAIAGLSVLGLFWGALVGLAGLPAAVICIAAFACVFVMRDFRVGALLLIAIMPISQSQIFPRAMFGVTGLNPVNLLILTTGVSLFMRSLGDGTWKHFLPKQIFLLALLPMIVGASMGVFHVEEIPKQFYDLTLIEFTGPGGYLRDFFFKPFTFVLFALLVAAAVERSEHQERFITPMIVSVFVMSLVAIGFVIISGVSLSQLSGVYARHFFSAIGLHANDLGRLYATAYGLLLFVWDRTSSRPLQFTLVVAMGLVAAALILTFSRGAFFGFVLVNIIFLVSRRCVRNYILTVLLLPVAIAIAPGALWSRLGMGFGESGANPNAVSAGRTNEIWAPLVPELDKAPFFGDGLGSILWSNAMLEGRLPLVAHPHNAFLQAYMDIGVVGLLALLGFWLFCWINFRRLSKDARLKAELRGFFEGAAAGTVAFVAAGFAGSSLAPAPEQLFLWLAIGVMFGVRFRFARATYGRKK